MQAFYEGLALCSFVVFVEGFYGFGGDLILLQEDTAAPGVLCEDEVNLAEDTERSECDVFQVPQGGGDEIELCQRFTP